MTNVPTRAGHTCRPVRRLSGGNGRWLLVRTFLAACLSGAIVGIAQDNPNRQIVVSTNTGREFTGNLVSLEGGQLTLLTPETQKLPTKNLIHLRFKNRQMAQRGGHPSVLLADGCLLATQAIGSDNETLTVRWLRFATWTPLKLPLDAVRGVIFAPPENADGDAQLWLRLTEHRDRHDLVLLNNGDTLTGQFVGLDETTVTLETAGGKNSIPRAGVRGIAFNPELMNNERMKGEGALLSLLDGSRFRIQNLKLGPGSLDRLECRTSFGARLDVPILTIDSLRFLGGCAKYLSELEPAAYRFEPFFDYEWPLRRDRTVRGGPLRLRGTEYPRGLGLHSQSEVTYPLNGAYRRFQATLGIDDDTQGKGSAIFEVLVDGKSVYQSDNLTGASQPVLLDRIDVTGAKLLTLRVGFGALADIQDHANWCDALLVK